MGNYAWALDAIASADAHGGLSILRDRMVYSARFSAQIDGLVGF